MDKFNAQLNRTIEDLCARLNIGPTLAMDLLELTPKSYRRIGEGQASFSIQNLEALCSNLDLSIDLLFSGQIDFDALTESYFGNRLALPHRYCVSEQKLARARSIQGMLSYVEDLKGRRWASRVASRLQIQNLANFSPDEFVSPFITRDLLTELTREGFSSKEIQAMGIATLDVMRRSELGQIFATKRSAAELYESMHAEHIDKFDHIWNYRLSRLTKQSCVVQITPREGAAEILKTPAFGTREICLFRQGVYRSMLGIIRKRHARLLEGACMYLGAKRCVYHLSWDQ